MFDHFVGLALERLKKISLNERNICKRRYADGSRCITFCFQIIRAVEKKLFDVRINVTNGVITFVANVRFGLLLSDTVIVSFLSV